MENTQPESWAIVELMGHVALAGRIIKPGEYGGLWQIDIPTVDTFRTEFFGSQSVYRIRMVSEQIARVYAPRHEVLEYNAPIMTREEHEQVVDKYRNRIYDLVEQLEKAKNQLMPGSNGGEEIHPTPDDEIEFLEDELDPYLDDELEEPF